MPDGKQDRGRNGGLDLDLGLGLGLHLASSGLGLADTEWVEILLKLECV